MPKKIATQRRFGFEVSVNAQEMPLTERNGTSGMRTSNPTAVNQLEQGVHRSGRGNAAVQTFPTKWHRSAGCSARPEVPHCAQAQAEGAMSSRTTLQRSERWKTQTAIKGMMDMPVGA